MIFHELRGRQPGLLFENLDEIGGIFVAHAQGDILHFAVFMGQHEDLCLLNPAFGEKFAEGRRAFMAKQAAEVSGRNAEDSAHGLHAQGFRIMIMDIGHDFIQKITVALTAALFLSISGRGFKQNIPYAAHGFTHAAGHLHNLRDFRMDLLPFAPMQGKGIHGQNTDSINGVFHGALGKRGLIPFDGHLKEKILQMRIIGYGQAMLDFLQAAFRKCGMLSANMFFSINHLIQADYEAFIQHIGELQYAVSQPCERIILSEDDGNRQLVSEIVAACSQEIQAFMKVGIIRQDAYPFPQISAPEQPYIPAAEFCHGIRFTQIRQARFAAYTKRQ